MEEKHLRPLICPLCQSPFRLEGKTLHCTSNHAFDIAREGYVNLLPGSTKQAKFMGDSKAMLQARRRFFAGGHYAPLAAEIAAQALAELAGDKTAVSPPIIVDAGCGEGYYLNEVAQAVGPTATFFGTDLAKEAARLAAKRYKSLQFVVADSKQGLPFATSSVELLLNIFAPRNPQAFARLLGKNGRLLIIIPTPEHLASLRQTFNLLSIEQDKENYLMQQFTSWFQLEQQKEIAFPLRLSQDVVHDLILMSPNARHGSKEREIASAVQGGFETAVSCKLLTFSKR